MKRVRKELAIDWIVLGSKQSDAFARRLQLKTYEHEAIDRKNFKCYPLSKWTNKDVMQHIYNNRLIEPLNYGNKKEPSQSNNIVDPIFLYWCKKNAPGDLKKIINEFPESELILYNYENK